MTSVEGIKVKPETDQEEVSKVFSKYNLTAAPVVDNEGRLIGILTVKDIISVVRQEATEDITKMVGTRAVDLREHSALKIVRFRMPWLVVTVFGGLLISLIIKFFEPTLAKVIALASFSPLIAGMGGNVGSQSATIMVRSLALGQVNGNQRLRAVFREMRVGILLGIIYGALLGGVAYAIYGAQYHFHFSLVVAAGMCTSMTVAATMGAIGPLFLERIGVDPATATGPLITTTTDIISNFTYFALATVLLMNF
jgi:magnesium transporter